MKISNLFCTQGVANIMNNKEISKFINESLNKFLNKDWGDISEDDKTLNDIAINEGDRILGVYSFKKIEYGLLLRLQIVIKEP